MAKEFKNILDLGGMITDTTEDKIPDRNASEVKNMDFSVKGLLQTKKGWSLVGNKIAEPGEILRGYIFKKNYGTLQKVMLRVRDDGTNSHLEWFNEDNEVSSSGKWEELIPDLTQGALMGFAPANGNDGEKVNMLVMCNGVDNPYHWNGATATIASVTATTIVANETLATSGDQEGFEATGTIIVDGTEYEYTGITTKTFTGVTPNPTVQDPASGVGITQKPTEIDDDSVPKGNVLLTSQRKLWVAGVADNQSKVYYSTSTDVIDFTITTGLGSGGTFDLVENGGKINLMQAKGKNGIVIHKDDAVILYSRESDSINVVENFDTLAKAEDSGATNIKGGTDLNNDSYFITGSEGLKTLFKALEGDSLQLNSITNTILPTLENWDLSNGSVIYHPKKRAIKMSLTDDNGDVKTITYYINTRDISIDDEPANDFMVKEGDVYMCSAIDQNVYKLYDRKSANGVEINHRYVTKSYTYNEPAKLKEFNTIFIEGLISESTKIKVSVLYGQFGVDGESSIILDWNSDYVTTQKISALGTDILGEVSLGGISEEIKDSFAFSLPIHVDASTKSTKYKIKVETYFDEETEPNGECYWALTSISTNPGLLGVEMNKMENINL